MIPFRSEKPSFSCSTEGETHVPGGAPLPLAERVGKRAGNRLPENCFWALKREKDSSPGGAGWEKGKKIAISFSLEA